MTTPADDGIRAAKRDAINARRVGADAEYHKAKAEVDQLLEDVKAHLESHAVRQEANPTNYGFVGDMTHYAELLNEILGRELKFYNVPDGKGGTVKVTVPK